MTMFNLFKNKQREEFDKDYSQFTKKYDRLVAKTTNITNKENNEDFIEATNRHILTFNDAFWYLENLDLDIASKLKPITAEQDVKKTNLRHKISHTKTALRDAINQFESVKSSYLQGIRDGYSINERN